MSKRAILAVVLGLCFCGTATADLSGLNPWTGNGRTWADTTSMSAEDPNELGKYLKADVEWVVEWVSSSQEFKYTYQVECTGDCAVTSLEVPMLESNEAENIGSYLVEAGNIAPTGQGFIPGPPAEPTLAYWDYAGLLNGQVSYGMTYWSVNAPLMLGGSIGNCGLFAAHGDVPSPSNDIPEPASASLLILGSVVLAGIRRRRR